MPSHGRGGRSPTKRKPPLPREARPQSTGPPLARTATFPIPPAPNIETITAADGDNSPRGSTIDTTNSPIPPAPNIRTTTAAGGDNGPSGSTIEATVRRTNTIGGGIETTTAIEGDINISGSTIEDTTDTTTPLGGEINSGGDSFDNNNNINNDSISQATTAIPHTQFDINQLESIIQRAVNKSVAEAVDKAFTSSLTDTSSKGYRLVNKVFDDLLDSRKRREESSEQEYRRFEADPELYLRQLDDDSANASVTTPTVTRPPTPTVTRSPTTTVTPRTATNTSLQQLMDNQRPGNSANWDATHACVQIINTDAEERIENPSHNNQCLHTSYTDNNPEER